MGIPAQKSNGFTIVEIVVVLAVIGILAAISIIGYGTWQSRTATNVVKTDLSGAASAMENARNFGSTYPTSLPSSFKPSPNVVLQLSVASAGQFCINAYNLSSTAVRMSYDSQKRALQNVMCSGAPLGSPIGGVPPPTPRNVNLVAGFSEWTLTGGVTYNSATGELVFGAAAGTATSPLIKVDSPTSAKITLESYATVGSPHASCTPNSCAYLNAFYYGADGVTAALNSGGVTSNGKAIPTPLSTWVNCVWSAPAGTDVVYVKFRVNSTPTTYTSDNRIRNPTIMAI